MSLSHLWLYLTESQYPCHPTNRVWRYCVQLLWLVWTPHFYCGGLHINSFMTNGTVKRTWSRHVKSARFTKTMSKQPAASVEPKEQGVAPGRHWSPATSLWERVCVRMFTREKPDAVIGRLYQMFSPIHKYVDSVKSALPQRHSGQCSLCQHHAGAVFCSHGLTCVSQKFLAHPNQRQTHLLLKMSYSKGFVDLMYEVVFHHISSIHRASPWTSHSHTRSHCGCRVRLHPPTTVWTLRLREDPSLSHGSSPL